MYTSIQQLHVESLLTVMMKFVRKDRGGGGKLVYLYIVKIEDFHQILTAFLRGRPLRIWGAEEKLKMDLLLVVP